MENEKPIGPIFVLILVILLSGAYYVKYLYDKHYRPATIRTKQAPPQPTPSLSMSEYEKESPEQVNTSQVPAAPSPAQTRISITNRGNLINAALEKMVSSEKNPEDPRYPHKALTDGNSATMTYPSGFAFEYDISLSNWADNRNPSPPLSYDIKEIVINWGVYGEKFYGEKDASGGWKKARHPGNYIDSYSVETIQPNADGWVQVHGYNGIPITEQCAGVVVEKKATGYAPAPYIVTTKLINLDLKNVSGIRIKAKASHHWSGIMEVEAWGVPR